MNGHLIIRFLLLGICCTGDLFAREFGRREHAQPPLRWTGSADWEYFESNGDNSQGTEASFNSLRQKYSVDLSGFLWDPRFNQFSLGLDLFQTDRDSENFAADDDGFGYRVQSTFFPSRPFPLMLFARKSITNVTGITLADSDRETAAWGMDWRLASRKFQRLRFMFERSSFDILSPLNLQERRRTGLVDFSKRFNNNELIFRYNLYDQEERVNTTQITRHDFVLNDQNRFRNGAIWKINAQYSNSNALFSSGVQDDLVTSRLSTRFDIPNGKRVRGGFNYDFNDNDGLFVDSTSHVAKMDGQFQISPRWRSTGDLSFGRIDTASASGDLRETLAGARTGFRFHQNRNRVQMETGYSLGYNQASFDTAPDRQEVSQFADLRLTFPMSGSDELFTQIQHARNKNDTTGVGFTQDEFRAVIGWEGDFRGSGRLRTSAGYRNSQRDTFQFGLQESDEITLDGSLSFRDGGVSLALSTIDGVSDFLPDPGSSSQFLPGTDLTSQSKVATLGVHWRFLRNLRFQLQARLENRDFTTIGKEDIFSYHPQIDYNIHTWQFSVGYSHYERRNGTEFTDDTLRFKVSKRFF